MKHPQPLESDLVSGLILKQDDQSSTLFIYLTMTAASSFNMPLISAPIHIAKDRPIDILAFDLPLHGLENDAKQGIGRWAIAFDQGKDPLSVFLDKATTYLTDLFNSTQNNYQTICFAGLSRGAFLASHLCARVNIPSKVLLGFSPVTSLSHLEDFKQMGLQKQTRFLDLKNLQKELASNPLKYYIGNNDRAVNTSSCIQTIEAIRAYAVENCNGHPLCELTLHPSLGYRGHGTAAETFESGARWALAKAD